jgi:hypothetical protein
MADACELKAPDHRLGEMAVQRTVGVFRVANERADDQADRREVLAVLEHDGDRCGRGEVRPDQLVAHLLQRSRRARAVTGTDAGGAVPEPDVVVSEAGPASPRDVEVCAVGVEVVILDPGLWRR